MDPSNKAFTGCTTVHLYAYCTDSNEVKREKREKPFDDSDLYLHYHRNTCFPQGLVPPLP